MSNINNFVIDNGNRLLSYNGSDYTVEIPNGIVYIEQKAFTSAPEVQNIVLSESVTSISPSAFSGAPTIKYISVTPGNPAYWSFDGVLFSRDNRRLIFLPPAQMTTRISLPSYLTDVEAGAISSCPTLKRIDVPSFHDTLKSVDDVLYSKDRSVLICYPIGKADQSYTVPDGTSHIRKNAFENCTSLQVLTLPATLTKIGALALSGCCRFSKINYRGTREQWEAIEKDGDWDTNAGDYKINFNYKGK